ncbi:hypothetical protein F0562_022525 [Nyssa sinensis]|uniref:Uncharacterized protein n=1 Tax=Nyssa sinensis TaxID=561372 RepID=A0A5J5BMY6_9ASTE|nr:hypothetical protein F0562_022525 [Nyssa sinensis]
MTAAISTTSCGEDVISSQPLKVANTESIQSEELFSEFFYNCKRDILAKYAMETPFSNVLDIKIPIASANENLVAEDKLPPKGTIPGECQLRKRVRSIMLAKNRFSGSLPPLNMPSLTFLDVNTNMLSGELLAEICNALFLASSSLSDNNFIGTIDNTLRKCLNLTDLVLFENHLFGEILAYLGKLKLVTLELSKNNLSGKIPH